MCFPAGAGLQGDLPSWTHYLLQNTISAGRLDPGLIADSFVLFQSNNSDPEQLPNVSRALCVVVTPPRELPSGDRCPPLWWAVGGGGGVCPGWQRGNESLYLQFCCEPKNALKGTVFWTSLVAQWLRLCAPNKGDWGSIPGQGT